MPCQKNQCENWQTPAIKSLLYCWLLKCCTGRPVPSMWWAGLLHVYIFPGWTIAATAHQPIWVVSQVGPASQAPVREMYASWGVQQPSTIYHRSTHHSIIQLTHNCISSCSLQMLLWVSLLMPSSIFLLSTTCQSKSISRRQCFQFNGHSCSLPVGLTSWAVLVIM